MGNDFKFEKNQDKNFVFLENEYDAKELTKGWDFMTENDY